MRGRRKGRGKEEKGGRRKRKRGKGRRRRSRRRAQISSEMDVEEHWAVNSDRINIILSFMSNSKGRLNPTATRLGNVFTCDGGDSSGFTMER